MSDLNVGLDGIAWYGREAVAIALYESDIRFLQDKNAVSWVEVPTHIKHHYRILAQYNRKPTDEA
jgi:hypothetical protein